MCEDLLSLGHMVGMVSQGKKGVKGKSLFFPQSLTKFCNIRRLQRVFSGGKGTEPVTSPGYSANQFRRMGPCGRSWIADEFRADEFKQDRSWSSNSSARNSSARRRAREFPLSAVGGTGFN
jgi:hypothetical protein